MRQYSDATNSASSQSSSNAIVDSVMANVQQHERKKGKNGSRNKGSESTISGSTTSSATSKMSPSIHQPLSPSTLAVMAASIASSRPPSFSHIQSVNRKRGAESTISESTASSGSTNSSTDFYSLDKLQKQRENNTWPLINMGGEGDNHVQAQMMTIENQLRALLGTSFLKNVSSPYSSLLAAASNATIQCQNGQSLTNSQSSSNSDAATPKGEMKQSPQMPFDIQQFIQQLNSSPPSISQQLSPSTLAYLATISPQPSPFCHSHPHPTPPPNVPTTQHHHSPPLFPLSPQHQQLQLYYFLSSLLQRQQQCNNNINPLPMNGQMIGGVNGQQQPNATIGMPLFGQQPQQMAMMMNGGGCPQQNGKQRNLTEGRQKSVKKNVLVKHNSTGDGQKSNKRRSSTGGGSVASSGTSSSSNITLMNSQQSINSNNAGTPSSSIMANSIEHLTMEENNIRTTTQMIQSNAPKETTKQMKQKRGGKGNKEVTSAGGRVPKKTRRMSVDTGEYSPSVNGGTPSSSKSFIQMDCQNSGQNNISPNGSSLGYSSSPDGTIASPNEGGGRTHYECEWANCNEQFDNSELFIAHVTEVHVEKEKETAPNFYCRWKSCKRSDPFSAQYMLAQHVRKHTGDKPYLCKYEYENGVKCDKAYSRLENLKTHERTHTGDRPYKCQFCEKSFTNASDKAKHQNRTHKNEKDYACPVHRCTKEYTDPSSLRKHVLHDHGPAVWKFAKENKEMRKAKNYGVIGIRQDGVPFAMPSGTTSSDEDKEVDVMSTTPPPPGQLPTLNENEAEMPMTGTDFNTGGGGNGGGGIGVGGGLPMGIFHTIEKQEIKQEPASPTNSNGHEQQWNKNQQQQMLGHQNIGKNSPSLPLHISPAQNQQWQQQQIGTTVTPNGSPMRSKPTGIALPTRHNNSIQQHFNVVGGGHHHQNPSQQPPQPLFLMPSSDDFSSPHQNRRLAHGHNHHHSFDEAKRASNSANSIVEFGHNGGGGTEWVEFTSAERHRPIGHHHAASIIGATATVTTAGPIEYMPHQHNNFGYSKCYDNSTSNIIYQQPQQSISAHLHHSSTANLAAAAPVHVGPIQHQFPAQYGQEKHQQQHYSAYVPHAQQQQRQHTESPQYHHSAGGTMANTNAHQQFHQNRIQQQQPISYQPQQSSQQIMPNGTVMAPQRSRHWSGPEAGHHQVYGHPHHNVHQMPILMDSHQQIPPSQPLYHQPYLNGQIRVPNQSENVDEAASNLIGGLQINNNKKEQSN